MAPLVGAAGLRALRRPLWRALPRVAQRRYMPNTPNADALEDDLNAFAEKRQMRVTLNMLMQTGQGELLHLMSPEMQEKCATATQKVQIQIASYLHRELPVRLAHRVKDLEAIPIMKDCPAVKEVCNWYRTSFHELRESPVPTTPAKEAAFATMMSRIYERHAPTLLTMARGAYEVRKLLNKDVMSFAEHDEIHRFLDRFYMSRIGIRLLIGQYLALKEPPITPDYVGIICTRTSPVHVMSQAIEDARYMCMRQHAEAPDVTLHGRLDLTWPFIPAHALYIFTELLKNSMRATVEHHSASGTLPPIRVIIADGEENEDVVIKVSDEGGGIKRSQMNAIWSYLYTTADPAVVEGFVNSEVRDFDTASPLAGLGYGLPIARNYARYFGGDLTLASMEGYGTDAIVHLGRLGVDEETKT